MNLAWAVAVGGALGSVARYWASNAVYEWLGRGFPYGTLAVNVSGGLLMGFLTELLVARYAVALEWRALLLVGFLGGFTTFSTFSIETWLLLQEGDLAKASHNAVASVVLCVAAVWLGLQFARWGFEEDWSRWVSLDARGARFAFLICVAYAAGMAAAHLSSGLALQGQTENGALLVLLVLIATGGAWYWLRGAGATTAGQLILVFVASAAVGGTALWLGWWTAQFARSG